MHELIEMLSELNRGKIGVEIIRPPFDLQFEPKKSHRNVKQSWRFTTGQELDYNEVFEDVTRANPIGVCRPVDGSKDAKIIVGIHSSLAKVFCPDKANEGMTRIMVTELDDISELSSLIDELKACKRPTHSPVTYEVTYPNAG